MDQELINISRAYVVILRLPVPTRNDRAHHLRNSVNRLIINLNGSGHIFSNDALHEFESALNRLWRSRLLPISEWVNPLVRAMLREGNSVRNIFRYFIPDGETISLSRRLNRNFSERLREIIYLTWRGMNLEKINQISNDFITDIAGSGYIFEVEVANDLAQFLCEIQMEQAVNLSPWANRIIRAILREGNTVAMFHESFHYFDIDDETRRMINIPDLPHDLIDLVTQYI